MVASKSAALLTTSSGWNQVDQPPSHMISAQKSLAEQSVRSISLSFNRCLGLKTITPPASLRHRRPPPKKIPKNIRRAASARPGGPKARHWYPGIENQKGHMVVVVVKTVLGVSHVGVGECTKPILEPILVEIGMFTGGTIWILTYGHMGLSQNRTPQPSHQQTWVCAQTPVERRLSSWLVGQFWHFHVCWEGGSGGFPLASC